MLVSSLYNIVDQIFIGQGVGYLGNAATNVAYPLTTICLAIALLIGIGSASRFSLELGAGRPENAAQAVGTAFTMMLTLGILYAILIELALVPLLTVFGATPDVMPYAEEYTRITAVGMPLLIVTNGMSSLARADGSPKYSMTCMLVGAIVNTILGRSLSFSATGASRARPPRRSSDRPAPSSWPWPICAASAASACAGRISACRRRSASGSRPWV